MTPQDFNKALSSFLHASQKMIDDHMDKHFPTCPRLVLSIEQGPRYVRVVKSDEIQTFRYLWAFIDKETGDVLKPDGWDAPAPGARGNLFAPDPMAGVTPFGVFGPEVRA